MTKLLCPNCEKRDSEAEIGVIADVQNIWVVIGNNGKLKAFDPHEKTDYELKRSSYAQCFGCGYTAPFAAFQTEKPKVPVPPVPPGMWKCHICGKLNPSAIHLCDHKA